jgi:hypothetical protein
MNEELDLKQLHTMTAFLKAESESTMGDTIGFIECLQKRHGLRQSLAANPNIEIEDIPDDIIKILREGKIPTSEDLLPLSSLQQDHLVMALIWIAGIERISQYCYDGDYDDSPVEYILAMRDVSDRHYFGSYLFAALTLLMSTIPSYDYVSSLCNDFEDFPGNEQFIIDRFIEVCMAIKTKYYEDIDWYYNFKEGEDEV